MLPYSAGLFVSILLVDVSKKIDFLKKLLSMTEAYMNDKTRKNDKIFDIFYM